MFDETKITFKDYKENYFDLRLNDYLTYPDNDEISFIENELIFFKDCCFSAKVEKYPNELLTNNMADFPYYINPKNIVREVNQNIYNEVVSVHQGFYKIALFNSEKSNQFVVTFRRIISFLEDKLTTDTYNPFPLIFAGNDNKTFLLFKTFTERHIIDKYIDFSFIFQQMKLNKYILEVKHLTFMDWLRENKYINQKEYSEFIIHKNFRSIKKCAFGTRVDLYLKLKESIIQATSDLSE